jgi:hypothetical protein
VETTCRYQRVQKPELRGFGYSPERQELAADLIDMREFAFENHNREPSTSEHRGQSTAGDSAATMTISGASSTPGLPFGRRSPSPRDRSYVTEAKKTNDLADLGCASVKPSPRS